MNTKHLRLDIDVASMKDNEIMNWALAELSKRFNRQSNKYYKLADAALQCEDKDSYQTFLAVAQTYKRAVEEVVSIEILTVCIRDERNAADDEYHDMGN